MSWRISSAVTDGFLIASLAKTMAVSSRIQTSDGSARLVTTASSSRTDMSASKTAERGSSGAGGAFVRSAITRSIAAVVCMPRAAPSPPAAAVTIPITARRPSQPPFFAGGASGFCSSPSSPDSSSSSSSSSSSGSSILALAAMPVLLLDGAQPAATAIGDPRLGDPVIGDDVVAADVERPDDAGDVEHPHLVVDAHFLRTADHHIAVGQHLGDHGGDGEMQLLRSVDLAGALGMRRQVERAGHIAVGRSRTEAEAARVQCRGDLAACRSLARPPGLVVESGVVVDVDGHGDHVPDPPG